MSEIDVFDPFLLQTATRRSSRRTQTLPDSCGGRYEEEEDGRAIRKKLNKSKPKRGRKKVFFYFEKFGTHPTRSQAAHFFC